MAQVNDFILSIMNREDIELCSRDLQTMFEKMNKNKNIGWNDVIKGPRNFVSRATPEKNTDDISRGEGSGLGNNKTGVESSPDDDGDDAAQDPAMDTNTSPEKTVDDVVQNSKRTSPRKTTVDELVPEKTVDNVLHNSKRTSPRKTTVDEVVPEKTVDNVLHNSKRTSPRKTTVDEVVPEKTVDNVLHNSKRTSPRKTTVDEVVPEKTVDNVLHNSKRTSPRKTTVDEVVKASKRACRNLAQENRKFRNVIKDPYHAEDSNEETQDNQEQGREKKKYLAAQKNARELVWSGEDDSSSDDVEEERKKTEIKTAKRKRVQWSQDEMEFLREGVKMFGVGNWSKIRDRYPFQNCHKNSVAIKDKYRTMVKRGEIVE